MTWMTFGTISPDATDNPMDYYMEALRREPDCKCRNNAVGLLLMRKGQFAMAESYFRKAVETLTERNPILMTVNLIIIGVGVV